MKPQMRSTKRLKARRILARSSCDKLDEEEDEESRAAVMVPKLVVPVKAFQPDSLLRISSAREMWSSFVEAGESLPTSLA